MNTENSDTQKEILETLQKMNRVLMVIEENQQMNSKLLEDLEDIKTNTFETFKSNSEGNSILSNLKWVLLAIGVMFFVTFRLGL